MTRATMGIVTKTEIKEESKDDDEVQSEDFHVEDSDEDDEQEDVVPTAPAG
jgi:hypothetical protein